MVKKENSGMSEFPNNHPNSIKKAQVEFNIGNWVQTKCEMSYYTQMQKSSFSVPFEKNYKRIKLTEDWLKRLQFEWIPCTWLGSLYKSKQIKNLTVFIDRKDNYKVEFVSHINWVRTEYCEYVDELQNLVKKWTDIELEHKK
jgi:hypothetical protein